MTANELAEKISLSRRVVVLTGALRGRQKSSEVGSISGYQPHYAMRGCPPATFDTKGELASTVPQGLCIEANFDEENLSGQHGIGAITASYEGRPLNMVHMVFGRSNLAPTSAEAKVIREAGELMQKMTGQPAHLVAAPVLSSGQMGVAMGRFYALALFRQTGETIWVHPAAEKLGLLKCPFPEHQRARSLDPIPVAAAEAPVEPEWYAQIHDTLMTTSKLRGLDLHNAVITHYSTQLLITKRATNQVEANRIAREEYETFKATKKSTSPAGPAEGTRNDAPLPAPKPRLSKAAAKAGGA
jgi:hypothetical protein